MRRKIIISAGHGGNDPGAVANGYTERDLAIEFRELLVKELLLLGIKPLIDDNKNALKQTLAWLTGKYSSKDILLDIHWNAASSKARGTEVIVPDNATGLNIHTLVDYKTENIGSGGINIIFEFLYIFGEIVPCIRII